MDNKIKIWGNTIKYNLFYNLIFKEKNKEDIKNNFFTIENEETKQKENIYFKQCKIEQYLLYLMPILAIYIATFSIDIIDTNIYNAITILLITYNKHIKYKYIIIALITPIYFFINENQEILLINITILLITYMFYKHKKILAIGLIIMSIIIVLLLDNRMAILNPIIILSINQYMIYLFLDKKDILSKHIFYKFNGKNGMYFYIKKDK